MVWASGDRGAPVPDLGHCASIGGLTAPLACCCANSRGWQRGLVRGEGSPPGGRNEAATQSWVRRHDEYGS